MKKIYTFALLPIIFMMTATSTVAPIMSPQDLVQLDEKTTNEKIDRTVDKIADTIKYKETKKDIKCTKRGLDGEYGCFQILPSTWNNLTKKHLGEVKGFTLELERPVVEMEIKELITMKKLEPKQIFKVWNSGNLKPCSRGYNKNGNYYDSCQYVQEAMAFYNKIK